MIKEQVNGKRCKAQSADSPPFTRHPPTHMWTHLTDSEAAGFVTLCPKFTDPAAKEDQNYATFEEHCHEVPRILRFSSSVLINDHNYSIFDCLSQKMSEIMNETESGIESNQL